MTKPDAVWNRDHSEEGGRVVVCYTVWNTEITVRREEG